MIRKLTIFLFLSLFLVSLDAHAISVGDQGLVSWKGKWYAATIRKISGTKFYIHYNGYGNEWDEWITAKRMRISVYWKGKWYKAKARKSSKSKIYIHYTGYDDSWDEWVSLKRVAFRGR